MPIDLLPSYGTPPNTADPDNFDARADAKVAADVVFVEQMNANTIPGINAAVEDVNDAMAAGLANAATNAATATTKAAESSASAASALTYRNAAQGFRDEAEYWAGVAEDAGSLPPVTGQGGKFLRVKADETGKEWAAAGARLVTEYLTSGTSWVAPATLIGGKVRFRMCGAGSSGASHATAGNTNRARMGASGGSCEGVADVTPGNAYTYAIGAPGASVAANTLAAGNAGGNTTMFGATANGGAAPAAGLSASIGDITLGGTASGGTINLRGASAVSLGTASPITQIGACPMGSVAIRGSNTNGVTATGFGAGGEGGNTTAASDAGRPGLIELTYLVTP